MKTIVNPYAGASSVLTYFGPVTSYLLKDTKPSSRGLGLLGAEKESRVKKWKACNCRKDYVMAI